MPDNSRSSGEIVNRPAVWLSGVLLLGAAAWNVAVGDWMDGLFLLGLGIGGALLVGAQEQSDASSTSVRRWAGIALLVMIALIQLGMLLRYLLLK